MVFKKIGSENLGAVVSLRLTTAEKEQLRHDAEIAGLSISEIVRRRYFGRAIIANADLVMMNELRRLGGLLKRVHTQSEGAYSKTTASLLNDLKAYIRKLSES